VCLTNHPPDMLNASGTQSSHRTTTPRTHASSHQRPYTQCATAESAPLDTIALPLAVALLSRARIGDQRRVRVRDDRRRRG
jgi:hypothetical protein